MVYRFIDQYKTILELHWLLGKFQISPNAYYNYLKQRITRIFLLRKGIRLSKTTVHKYMNKDLDLHAIVMGKKLKYVRGAKNKVFTNLLKQDFRTKAKNKI